MLNKLRSYVARAVMESILVVLCIILAFTAPNFLTAENILNILRTISMQGVIAFGMTMVIISGEIDLSVGSAAAFAACLTALMVEAGFFVPIAIVISLTAGFCLGTFTGIIRAKYQVPTFITSLALLTGLRGAARLITKGFPLAPDFPHWYTFIGSGYVLNRIPFPLAMPRSIIVDDFGTSSSVRLELERHDKRSMDKTTSLDPVCHRCDAQGMPVFFELSDVPVHSCSMMSSQQEALKVPRGDICLGFCEQCGFIANVAFDPTVEDYSPAYEDQQTFSPTFNAFAKELANDLIQKYDLHSKDIIEIGCGKGDFLILLCELGNNRGVGIDPSAVTGRVQSEATDRVTFIQDYYSERYADHVGDLVCCRHTLEHIHQTVEFVSTVRRSIGDPLDTVVFFEVPDMTRVLQEVAFEDIYYEHCSYFTPGSLARLFRSCGFEVTDLYRAYRDQYLLIEALPVIAPSDKVHPLEESLEQVARDVGYFSNRVGKRLQQWKQQLQEVRASGKRAVVWGSGSKCVAFLSTLRVTDLIDYVVDINPYRQGKFIPGVGKEIMPPEFLKEYRPDQVIVMNPIYCDEIQDMLDDMGVAAEVTSL